MNRCSYCFTVNVVDGANCEASPTKLHAPKTYHLPGQHEQESHGGDGEGGGNTITFKSLGKDPILGESFTLELNGQPIGRVQPYITYKDTKRKLGQPWADKRATVTRWRIMVGDRMENGFLSRKEAGEYGLLIHQKKR